MSTSLDHVSTTVLEETPRRAVEFIRGIGSSAEVMRSLTSAGYTVEAHEEGIRLVNNVLRFVARPSVIPKPSVPSFGAAVKEIKHWVKTDFRRIKLGLQRFFPAQADYLFTGLDIAGPIDAVALVELFLQRLDSLGHDADRKATRKADHAALSMIEARGITKASLKHLNALVTEAQTPPAVAAVEALGTANDDRLEALVALRRWYADWAGTARIVLNRREHLIRVGLASRKMRTPAPSAVVVTAAAPSAPPPAPDAPVARALPMSTSPHV
jgi:hypothetical protein